ncbi:MAG: carbohydrate kinase family protein [Pseudomonadota bacterium]
MNRHGVMTGGTWCVDRNLVVSSWPAENGFAAIEEELLCGGGSSYNMGANLKSLDPDLPVTTIGRVGEDADGAFLIETAAAHGIDASGLKTIPDRRTDYTLAFASKDTGRRTHISGFDAAKVLSPDDFDFSGSTARLFHLGLPGIHEVMDAPWRDEANGWASVLAKARRAGLKTNMELVSIAPERIAALIRPCLAHLDLLVVNDHEIGGLAGMQTVPDGAADPTSCLKAARHVLASGSCTVVVVHFPEGAIATTADTVVALPSVTVPAAANKGANGAGDAFAAGFVYGWHEGWGLEESLRLAHAAAAASLRDITTTGAVENWRTCLALAADWGWRSDERLSLMGARAVGRS